jgi:hypothetical protein
VVTSAACWLAMAGLLAGLTFLIGPLQMLNLYFVPYWVLCTVLFSSFSHAPCIYPTTRNPLLSLACRYLLCGWTLSPTCTTMAMTTSFPGTVERYVIEDNANKSHTYRNHWSTHTQSLRSFLFIVFFLKMSCSFFELTSNEDSLVDIELEIDY